MGEAAPTTAGPTPGTRQKASSRQLAFCPAIGPLADPVVRG